MKILSIFVMIFVVSLGILQINQQLSEIRVQAFTNKNKLIRLKAVQSIAPIIRGA